MARPSIPAHIREQQINEIPNIRFVRWDGPYRGAPSKAFCRCEVDGYEWATSVHSLLTIGSGSLIAALEKGLHGKTEQVEFSETFDGHTEWRKWTPEIPKLMREARIAAGVAP